MIRWIVLLVAVPAVALTACDETEKRQQLEAELIAKAKQAADKMKTEMAEKTEAAEKTKEEPPPPAKPPKRPALEVPPRDRKNPAPWRDKDKIASTISGLYTVEYLMQKRDFEIYDEKLDKTWKLKLKRQYVEKPYITAPNEAHILADMTPTQGGGKVVLDFQLVWFPQAGLDQKGRFKIGAIAIYRAPSDKKPRFRYIKKGKKWVRRP
jgi:hypothetical protein